MYTNNYCGKPLKSLIKYRILGCSIHKPAHWSLRIQSSGPLRELIYRKDQWKVCTQMSVCSNCLVFNRTTKSLNWRVDISHLACRVYKIQMSLLYELKKVEESHLTQDVHFRVRMKCKYMDETLTPQFYNSPLQCGKLTPAPDIPDSLFPTLHWSLLLQPDLWHFITDSLSHLSL